MLLHDAAAAVVENERCVLVEAEVAVTKLLLVFALRAYTVEALADVENAAEMIRCAAGAIAARRALLAAIRAAIVND